jgi:hypothetical protein
MALAKLLFASLLTGREDGVVETAMTAALAKIELF